MTGGTAAGRPPTRVAFDEDSVLYYEVRSDVFDSLNVWARQHDPLLAEVASLWSALDADSVKDAIHKQIEDNLRQQLRISTERADLYQELWRAERPGFVVRVWNKIEFPVGIGLGAFLTVQVYKLR
jgi:hypothetical protein